MIEQIDYFHELLNQYNDLPYAREVYAFCIFLFFIALRSIFAKVIIGFAKKLTTHTESRLDYDIVVALENPVKFLFVVFGISVSATILELESNWQLFSQTIIANLYTYSLFWGLFNTIDPLSEILCAVGNKMGKQINSDLRNFVTRTFEVIVVVIGGVALLEQWYINVSAFLGGLGLAGMAIALAAKDTVANLFGTLTIFMDKTFHKGDWIQTPQVEGVVEHIGLRACKIRTFAKALVNVPNAELSNSPITNWSKMTNRRITMNLSLEYRTTAEQLENIVKKLRDYIKNDEAVANEGDVIQMVHLSEFAASSIDINLYYFTKTRDWGEFRQVKNDHILAFKRIVEDEKAAFAFPSHSLYVEHLPPYREVPAPSVLHQDRKS